MLQMSIISTIKNELQKKNPQPNKPAKKSRKATKALQQHMETVASLKKST